MGLVDDIRSLASSSIEEDVSLGLISGLSPSLKRGEPAESGAAPLQGSARGPSGEHIMKCFIRPKHSADGGPKSEERLKDRGGDGIKGG